MEPHATGEDDEALEQGLAAGYVLQLQVRDTEGKLGEIKVEGEGLSGSSSITATTS